MAQGSFTIITPPPQLVVRESDGRTCVLGEAWTESGKLVGLWLRVDEAD